MALIVKDRVKETCSAPGTGTVTLLGASTGYSSFSVIGNGNTTYYCIADQGGANWEVGIGTYTASGTTLSRDTVLSNSAGTTALINFSSGTQDVFVTYPAERASVTYTGVKTANYTAGENEGVLADTTGGAFTVTLPASPSINAQVVVADPAGTWGTNNLTIGRNGSTIADVAQDLVCDISGVSVQLVYDGTTWAVYAQVGGNGGTAVTLDGVQTLTNKTISADNNTISGIAASSFVLSNASGNIDGSAAQKVIPSGTVVGTSDSQTLTNKTLTDPAIIGTILEDVYTITDGAAFEVDPSNGSVQLITLGASRTPKATNFAAGEAITLMVNDGSAYTITWTDATWGGSGVVWMTDGGTAPTLATTGYTTIVLWKVSTQVYGARVGDNA